MSRLTVPALKDAGDMRLYIIAMSVLLSTSSCNKNYDAPKYKNEVGQSIEIDHHRSLIFLDGKRYQMRDCSNSQFYCYTSEIIDILSPKICRTSQNELDDWNVGAVKFVYKRVYVHGSYGSGIYVSKKNAVEYRGKITSIILRGAQNDDDFYKSLNMDSGKNIFKSFEDKNYFVCK